MSKGWAVIVDGEVVEYTKTAGSAKLRALELRQETGKNTAVRCLEHKWVPVKEVYVDEESEPSG